MTKIIKASKKPRSLYPVDDFNDGSRIFIKDYAYDNCDKCQVFADAAVEIREKIQKLGTAMAKKGFNDAHEGESILDVATRLIEHYPDAVWGAEDTKVEV